MTDGSAMANGVAAGPNEKLGTIGVSRRRVAILDHTAMMGGGEIALLNLATHLDRSRFDVLVVLFSDGPLARRLESAGVRVRLCPLDPALAHARKDGLGGRSLLGLGTVFRAGAFVRRLARVLKAENVELVHTNSLKADVLGGLAGKLAGLPVVWHVRDRIADDYLPRRVAAAFRLGCRLIPDYVIANSNATLRTLGPVPNDKAAVVTSGYSGRRAGVVHDGTVAARAANGNRDDHRPVVGVVGRLAKWKGQHVFLDAATCVLRQHPTAEFRLIGAALFGEADYERRLREQVARSNIGHAVEFCGFCDDVPDRIAALDVLVHASVTGEPFGQVVIEGMAAGKPVVATDGGGIPEIVVDGVTGLLVPMGDAAAMADAICQLLNDPALAARMGAAGLTRVGEHFTIRKTAESVQAIYQQVLADRSESR